MWCLCWDVCGTVWLQGLKQSELTVIHQTSNFFQKEKLRATCCLYIRQDHFKFISFQKQVNKHGTRPQTTPISAKTHAICCFEHVCMLHMNANVCLLWEMEDFYQLTLIKHLQKGVGLFHFLHFLSSSESFTSAFSAAFCSAGPFKVYTFLS